MAKRRKTTDLLERFGTAVKFRREELGITQEDLAERAQLHRTYISDIERGARNVSLINVDKLARSLDLTLAGLMESL